MPYVDSIVLHTCQRLWTKRARAHTESNARRDDDLGLNMSFTVVQADVYRECERVVRGGGVGSASVVDAKRRFF